MCIIEPAETNFRAIGASGTTLSFKTRGELPADEADRVPVGVVVTFTYTWTPDPLVFGNGEFTCRFDWEGGGYDSNGTEIGEPDVTEWTFDAFMIGMGPAGSPDEPRKATVWFDDITYSVETAYEIPSDSVFANTSTRGRIDGSTTPEAILTPGIVISGNDPKTVLIRAVGPTLGDFGVTGFCPNPILTLYDQDDTENPIATNTNWGDAANAAQIEAAAVTVGAFALTTGSADAAILMTLPTNKAYTAQASCGDAGMGDVLVETYAVD